MEEAFIIPISSSHETSNLTYDYHTKSHFMNKHPHQKFHFLFAEIIGTTQYIFMRIRITC